ncbi:MAG: DUF4105 domain-containing protein [Treponema sp.]|jgi:heme/copper-type cytochrome/quinol oxidase subunit 4|nr:DUF4105 domain-containing protein [Treponema sp.]
MKKKILFFLIMLILAVSLLPAQGENLTVKVAVMGPGDQLYFWWGHISLIIEDAASGRNYLYDYGQFSFEQENFFVNFALGRLYYNCGVSPAEWALSVYPLTNRDVFIYTLNVPPAKRLEIKEFADNNVLPENKYYEYHHFKDNCSTRIRDIIDMLTDGQFYEQFGEAVSRYTLRQHVRRHTWFSPPGDWILNFWMGQGIDTPITVWEDMFLPSEVGRNIEDFYYIDSNGVRTKLVTSIETISLAENRPAVLEIPRKQWPRQLVFSLVLSLVFGFFFFLTAKNKKAGRILAGISMSLSGLVFGFAASLLYFLSLFTNHDYTYNNMNMIFCTPILLAAVPFGIYYAFTKNQEKLVTYGLLLRLIWLLPAAGVIISMILKIFPWFWQQNLTDQMLILPIALVFTLQPVGMKESCQKLKKWIKRK